MSRIRLPEELHREAQHALVCLRKSSPQGRTEVRRRLRALGEDAAARIPSGLYSPRDTAIILQSYGVAAVMGRDLLSLLTQRVKVLASRFVHPQLIAITLWALSTLELAGALPIDRSTVVATRQAMCAQLCDPQVLWGWRWTPLDVSQSAWALVVVRHSSAAVMNALAERVVAPDMKGRFGPQALGTTLWAYTVARREAPAMFAVLFRRAADTAASYEVRNATQVISAVVAL
eukprot:Hpha_TRINITY_DN33754_c0_g1::TRINITY_DN33754_c0_g1_i1::g.25006::m.25006